MLKSRIQMSYISSSYVCALGTKRALFMNKDDIFFQVLHIWNAPNCDEWVLVWDFWLLYLTFLCASLRLMTISHHNHHHHHYTISLSKYAERYRSNTSIIYIIIFVARRDRFVVDCIESLKLYLRTLYIVTNTEYSRQFLCCFAIIKSAKYHNFPVTLVMGSDGGAWRLRGRWLLIMMRSWWLSKQIISSLIYFLSSALGIVIVQ